MGDFEFDGAAPDGDPREMLQEIIDACLHYARQARQVMQLHESKRIAIGVPVSAMKRPLFEQVEAQLWDLGVRLDWSGYTTWQVPYSLAEGSDPLDLIGFRQQPSALGPQGGWRVTPRAQRMPFSMTAQEARAFAARLLAAADACEEHERQMPAAPAEPPSGI
jgi:hypothetical protein